MKKQLNIRPDALGYRMTVNTRDGLKAVKMNRRVACRLFCFQCTGFEEAETRRCTGKMMDGSMCQLHPFRMRTGKQNEAARAKAIVAHCRDCYSGRQRECESIHCPLWAYRNAHTDRTHLVKILPGDDKEDSSE